MVLCLVKQEAHLHGMELSQTQEQLYLYVEGWVQRRIFGPKREEVTRGWRKQHNESFIMYTLPDINKVIK